MIECEKTSSSAISVMYAPNLDSVGPWCDLTRCCMWYILGMEIVRYQIIRCRRVGALNKIENGEGKAIMDTEGCGVPAGRDEPVSISEVYQLLDIVGKKLTRLQREDIRGADLTPAQYSVLTMLWEKDARPFNELATGCCCSPSTITGIVDTLESKGLVSRAPNPGDRRSLLVTLTEDGSALRNSTPSLEMIFGDCCPAIAPDELQELARLLRKLNDTLQA
jgi:DNA-binding MarR family transcriptional regulator